MFGLAHVLPLRCLPCPGLTRGSELCPFLCVRCARELHKLRDRGWEIDGTRVIAAFHYTGPVRALIRKLKFHGAIGVASLLGSALAVDPEADMSIRLLNLVTQKRARLLLDHADELFEAPLEQEEDNR